MFSRFPSTKSRFLCASYWGCWPGCGKIGLCERNTERWELKSRIAKGRVTLWGDRMCCGEQNGWFRKRKARNFGVCALLLFVLLPGPPCGRGPTCRTLLRAGPDAGRGRLVELVLDEELDGLVFCHSEFVVEDCGVVVSLLCAEPEFSLV